MFNGTVEFNVMFNSGASYEQMVQAATQANAYDFIVNDQFELQEDEEMEEKEGSGF